MVRDSRADLLSLTMHVGVYLQKNERIVAIVWNSPQGLHARMNLSMFTGLHAGHKRHAAFSTLALHHLLFRLNVTSPGQMPHTRKVLKYTLAPTLCDAVECCLHNFVYCVVQMALARARIPRHRQPIKSLFRSKSIPEKT